MSFKLEVTCGELTCASDPGNFCQFVRTERFGTQWVCGLFDRPLFDDENGWLKRCDQCLEKFTEKSDVTN